MKLAAWLLLLFACALLLFTRANRFPFFYHPDEPDKVEQVVTGTWKFEHPMLLITASRWAVQAAKIGDDWQRVVIVGRWMSALFTAVAVVALSLLAWSHQGWPGAWIAGVALALHHQLFELAHYMKEDTALLVGVAVTFLALTVYWKRPGPMAAALLGAGCGLALSGKYVGVMMVAMAVPVVIFRKVPRARDVVILLFAMAAIFALLNFPMLSDLGRFQKSLSKETGLVVEGQRGMTRSVPHSVYWNAFIDNSNPVVWIFFAVYLVAFYRTRRSRSLPEWITVLFPFGYALMLSFSPKTNDRYFLPATAVIIYLSALGAVAAAELLSGRISRRVALALCGGLAVLGQVPGLVRYARAFQHDDRAELVAYLRREVPAEALLAEDSRVMLPHPDARRTTGDVPPIPQRVLPVKRSPAELGSLEELRARGITHLAVSQSSYGRYFLSSIRARKGGEAQHEQMHDFYEQLFREGELLFEREYGTVIYLHPGLRLYRISPLEKRGG